MGGLIFLNLIAQLYVSNELENILAKDMLECLQSKGGSLYIQKAGL